MDSSDDSKPGPKTPTFTHSTPFGRGYTGQTLFAVQAGIPTEVALTQACEVLAGTAATLCEMAEICPVEYRPLARSAIYQLEVATALVESSVPTSL
ncbi:DUF3077 domain-containing protein [Pseudomonas sp. HR96]|uniref:DUF3077 domain-containing protein n=1 Tax=Pseudomonas sp. HR96 TaxID=1027966 RepID=UPI002A7483E0|nr:DUF3077 domain-containing protein [Pseudomonas sp. HR96]WPO98280.1 DUF3077 domain-containing protein [Pseudomonas sp. HR96]